MSVEEIKLAVCEAFEIQPSKLDIGRTQKVAEARFAVRFITQKKTGMGGHRLSRVFQCNPGSITWARNRFKDLHDTDPSFRKRIALVDYLLTDSPKPQSMHQPI